MILRGWRNLCKQGSNQNQICFLFFFFNHECSILWASVAVVGKITSQHPRWLLSAQRLGWRANVAHMQVLEQHFLGRVCLFLKCQTTFCLCYCSMICNERGTAIHVCQHHHWKYSLSEHRSLLVPKCLLSVFKRRSDATQWKTCLWSKHVTGTKF